MSNQQSSEIILPRVADVAKYMLIKKGSLTGFELEKLLYYCQAWSLAIDRKPLFREEIHAYENGPVVKAVSMQHMGRRTVLPSSINGDVNALSDTDVALIDAVLEAYEGMTGDQLAQLSHEEEPWQVSFNGLNGNAAAVIPSELIQSYYVHLLTASAADQQYHHVPRFDHPKNIYINQSDFDWLVSYLDEE